METTHNYLFVSDLHLSEGRDPESGRLSRNEDFFQDAAFARFLAYHVNLSWGDNVADHYRKPWQLVVNGDIFDFLQVVSLPAEGDELSAVRGVRTYAELSPNEREYGLGTRSTEIVWKLKQVAEGHPLFFQALAWFVAHEGYQLVLLKGNHDIEIYWPDAQQGMRKLLAKAYKAWYEEASRPGASESPLPFHEDLPSELSQEALQASVCFPPSIYFEEELFYVEHGCQYDPANAFNNFEEPKLPDAPELIELPSGSFFVRYFFNKVESVHPFADNMKPILRYVKWVISNAPSAMVHFLLDLLPKFLTAYRQLQKKKSRSRKRRQQKETRIPFSVLMHGAGEERSLSEHFRKELLKIQLASQEKLSKGSKKTTWGMVLSIILIGASVVLILLALRGFVVGNYGWMALYLVVAVVLAFFSSYLSRRLDALLESAFLREAAAQICCLLNSSEGQGPGSVRYFIFGHDHVADVEEFTRATAAQEAAYKQWYVNTGAWIPVFSEEQRLLRGDVQLTFLRLVPGKPDFKRGAPELLQWSPEANRPRPVRLFGEG